MRLEDYRDGDDDKPKRRTLTQARLQEVLYYDKDTGDFMLNQVPGKYSGGREVGDRINNKSGIIELDGNQYPLHRLAFLYMEGKIPPFVRFKDKDRTNLIWDNLEGFHTKSAASKPRRSFGKFGINTFTCLKCDYCWQDHRNAPCNWIRCVNCHNVLRYEDIKLG